MGARALSIQQHKVGILFNEAGCKSAAEDSDFECAFVLLLLHAPVNSHVRSVRSKNNGKKKGTKRKKK